MFLFVYLKPLLYLQLFQFVNRKMQFICSNHLIIFPVEAIFFVTLLMQRDSLSEQVRAWGFCPSKISQTFYLKIFIYYKISIQFRLDKLFFIQ